MEDFLTQKDFEIQKELGCRISMYLGKILWQRKNVFYMIFYSVGWFDTIGKFSILREYVLKMDLMHSGNLIILYTMYRCIPSYGAHCPSRNTPQRDLRKRGDWIWGDLVAHSLDTPILRIRFSSLIKENKKQCSNLSLICPQGIVPFQDLNWIKGTLIKWKIKNGIKLKRKYPEFTVKKNLKYSQLRGILRTRFSSFIKEKKVGIYHQFVR